MIYKGYIFNVKGILVTVKQNPMWNTDKNLVNEARENDDVSTTHNHNRKTEQTILKNVLCTVKRCSIPIQSKLFDHTEAEHLSADVWESNKKWIGRFIHPSVHQI